MKSLKYLFTLFCLALASLTSAQVAEFHVNEQYHNDGQTHVAKFYLSNVDSIVYVPALDWTPKLEIIDYYQDDQSQVHVRLHATTGPDADFARLYFGEKEVTSSYFYNIDRNPEQDTLTNYTLLDKGSDLELDFPIPNANQLQWASLITGNARHFPKGYVYYAIASCKIDAASWLEEQKWQSLGKGTYTDDVLTIFGIEPQTYEVEVQENKDTPGLYRLLNPYANHPEVVEGEFKTDKNYHIVIHAEDPSCVYVEKQETGLDWGYGSIAFSTLGNYYMDNGSTKEEVMENLTNAFGTMTDGIISFPQRGLVVSMGENAYYGGRNGAARLVLPGTAAKQEKGDAPKKVPNGAGRKLNAEPLQLR